MIVRIVILVVYNECISVTGMTVVIIVSRDVRVIMVVAFGTSLGHGGDW